MKPALLQIQHDVTGKLRAELASWNINVQSLRKLLVAGELDTALITLTPVNEQQGAGVLVEMPAIDVDSPNMPGPECRIDQTVLVLENPTINLGPSGTLREAEHIAVRVQQLIHLFRIQGIGTFYAAPNAITPANEFDGVIGYRVAFRLLLPMEMLARTGNPILTAAGLQVTCSNAAGSSSAAIWYSIDGETYPGPDQVDTDGVPTSFLYTEPFTAAVGDTVRAAAYKSGATGSDITELTLT